MAQGRDHGRGQDGNGRRRSESQLPGRAEQRVGQDRYEACVQSVDRGQTSQLGVRHALGNQKCGHSDPGSQISEQKARRAASQLLDDRERGDESVPHRRAS